jgi:hypothetical protein
MRLLVARRSHASGRAAAAWQCAARAQQPGKVYRIVFLARVPQRAQRQGKHVCETFSYSGDAYSVDFVPRTAHAAAINERRPSGRPPK